MARPNVTFITKTQRDVRAAYLEFDEAGAIPYGFHLRKNRKNFHEA